MPENVDFDVIDGFEKVTDKDAAVYTRRMAREEGIFAGNSCGAAVKGLIQLKEHFKKDDVVVVLLHDSGSRYVGKMYNDDWMRERGFLEKKVVTAGDLVNGHENKPLVSVFAEELVSHAIGKMRKFGISQIPVLKDNKFVGSVDDSAIYQALVDRPELSDSPISSIMGPVFPIVKNGASVDELCKLINKSTPAVLVERADGSHHIVTRYDIISAMS